MYINLVINIVIKNCVKYSDKSLDKYSDKNCDRYNDKENKLNVSSYILRHRNYFYNNQTNK